LLYSKGVIAVLNAKATPERLSMFSDGVFAVLITVLVLELRPPETPTFRALLSLWPTWLSYAVSYLFHSDRLGQSSSSPALRDTYYASVDVVQFCASVFRVTASSLNRMDGRK
jgi:hypothetical protein